jgi:hypothetical protein
MMPSARQGQASLRKQNRPTLMMTKTTRSLLVRFTASRKAGDTSSRNSARPSPRVRGRTIATAVVSVTASKAPPNHRVSARVRPSRPSPNHHSV